MGYSSYKELIVWQKAMDLVDEVYRLVRLLPRDEMFAFSDQIRRSAVSIPSNIAEGQWAAYRERSYHSFLPVPEVLRLEVETQDIHQDPPRYYFTEEAAKRHWISVGKLEKS